MKTIDLTLPIYTGMPVYPGDPEVKIEQVQTIANDQWNMKRLHINSHDGTHVNVPIHSQEHGKTLDHFNLDCFFGNCVLYESNDDIQAGVGVIFSKENITTDHAQLMVDRKPLFVGLSDEFDFNLDAERLLLEHEIISFENLTNTERLPKKFMFYGIPLNIKEGDGSPVRAFAVIE